MCFVMAFKDTIVLTISFFHYCELWPILCPFYLSRLIKGIIHILLFIRRYRLVKFFQDFSFWVDEVSFTVTWIILLVTRTYRYFTWVGAMRRTLSYVIWLGITNNIMRGLCKYEKKIWAKSGLCHNQVIVKHSLRFWYLYADQTI